MSTQRQHQRPREGDDKQKPLTLWQTWTSVLSAFFGVQSSANKERDLSRGKASHFIILGIIATLVLIGSIIGGIKLLIALSGVQT